MKRLSSFFCEIVRDEVEYCGMIMGARIEVDQIYGKPLY